MSIKLIIDSSSDIDAVEAEKRNIIMIPIEVSFGEQTYLDGVNLTKNEFFEKLIEDNVFPKTSQINKFRYDEAFKKAVEDGSDAVCITLSSKLSATYQSAVDASKKYGGKVRVVDSKNACLGERVLIDYAQRLILEGRTLDEIESTLNKAKGKIRVLALLNTLQYLQKGGRISLVTAFAGGLLNIKPVVAVKDGEVKLVGKAIGSKKGNNLLAQLIEKSGGVDFDMPYGVGYSGLSDELLQKYLSDSAHMWEEHTTNVPEYQVGSTIGAHVGPGGIVVAFFAK
ncbi:MAG: DegV family protein [Clostridia bacterium]|nr:DegV family protein [Clostridia bacterium]